MTTTNTMTLTLTQDQLNAIVQSAVRTGVAQALNLVTNSPSVVKASEPVAVPVKPSVSETEQKLKAEIEKAKIEKNKILLSSPRTGHPECIKGQRKDAGFMKYTGTCEVCQKGMTKGSPYLFGYPLPFAEFKAATSETVIAPVKASEPVAVKTVTVPPAPVVKTETVKTVTPVAPAPVTPVKSAEVLRLEAEIERMRVKNEKLKGNIPPMTKAEACQVARDSRGPSKAEKLEVFKDLTKEQTVKAMSLVADAVKKGLI